MLRLFQSRHLGRDCVVVDTGQQAIPDRDRDLVGVKRPLDREQPIAALVLLADADRLVCGTVKLFADLHLDQRALFLDHDDEIEPLGEFDQFVARHVGPMLAETTERLLAQVTNSKYSQIRFDENYGIHVFDGDEDFPLSSFSGGERDVVALCARLALSEIVGSAAARPPRFLVLDEVFASLDVDRREQLLETLGVLANGGHFRQVFIISHVEDVQQSPVMNEAWTISERDGSSYVERPAFFSAPLPAG